MHRVFRSGQQPDSAWRTTIDGAACTAAFAALRAFLRSLGLEERPCGDTYLYYVSGAAGAARQLATLHGALRTATIYLYADALGQQNGYGDGFYRTVEDAGLGMGSKLGPSVAMGLDQPRQLATFRAAMTALLGPAVPATPAPAPAFEP